MKSKKQIIIAGAIGVLISSAAYGFLAEKQPIEFYKGHTHDENGHAVDAPEHSGGLDRKGCHNKSVPYHCH
jgi:hypothetical protein